LLYHTISSITIVTFPLDFAKVKTEDELIEEKVGQARQKIEKGKDLIKSLANKIREQEAGG